MSTEKTYIIPAQDQQDLYEQLMAISELSDDREVLDGQPLPESPKISETDRMLYVAEHKQAFARTLLSADKAHSALTKDWGVWNAALELLSQRDQDGDAFIDAGFLDEDLIVSTADDAQKAKSPTEVLYDVYEARRAGVFRVVAKYKGFLETETSQGSGFIVDKAQEEDGTYRYLLFTNAHVADSTMDDMVNYDLAEETSYRVVTDDDSLTIKDVRLINSDPVVDTALLEFRSDRDLPVSAFNVDVRPRRLQSVVVVGNTHSLGISPNIGQIKNERTGIVGYDFATIQHDASATSGNSGGPIYGEDGGVVAVHFRGYTDGSVKYGIPADRARKSLDNMLEHADSQTVVYGYWGARFYHMNSDERETVLPEGRNATGIGVSNVIPGSPADRAGLKDGDIIVAVNGDPEIVNIINHEGMYKIHELIRDSKKGDAFRLTVVRKDKTGKLALVEELKLVSGERAYGKVETCMTDMGFQVSDITEEFRENNGLPKDLKGVVIDTADHSHILQEGGIMVNANGHPVTDVASFRKILADLPEGEPLVLEYLSTAYNYNAGYLKSGRDALVRKVIWR